MNREKVLDSIPIDLITEIHSRLPAKSVARFRCVSKLWCSMLRRPYFIDLFLTRSWARPRILFILQRGDEWSFFSSPQPQNPYDNSFVVADFHMKFFQHPGLASLAVTSGLVYFPSLQISKKIEDEAPVVCNPRTGQYMILPKLLRDKWSYSFLGYDPIDNQHKVLFMASPYSTDDHKILTLGTRNMCWRKLECSLTHDIWSREICINGVLYYLASPFDEKAETSPYVIVCFDVRSEKFKFIDIERFYIWSMLINYKGKLGGISWENVGNILELRIWILEDVNKHEWSKYVYTLGEDAVLNRLDHFIVGVTPNGEIVFSMRKTSKPFYVYYFNPEMNTLRKVKIQALDSDTSVYAFVNFVEDLNVNDSKQLKSSLANRGLNIIRRRPQPQQRRHTSSRDLSNSASSVKNKQPTTLLQNKYDLLANLE
ncbi:F-box protein [Cardamine amara subsp. amara]|uniref:F-box protein n=1 Tax=Cardamine amara subsp. amara TaxID=228776 RepID=A0ABD0ZX35_CARAN